MELTIRPLQLRCHCFCCSCGGVVARAHSYLFAHFHFVHYVYISPVCEPCSARAPSAFQAMSSILAMLLLLTSFLIPTYLYKYIRIYIIHINDSMPHLCHPCALSVRLPLLACGLVAPPLVPLPHFSLYTLL